MNKPAPAPKILGLDKMPLADYIAAILDGFAEGLARFEERHGDWRGGSMRLEPEVILKPVRVDRGGRVSVEVWVDLDEPEKFPRTRLPLHIVRRPGEAEDWKDEMKP